MIITTYLYKVDHLPACLPAGVVRNATMTRHLDNCLSECVRMEYDISTVTAQMSVESIERFIAAIDIPYNSS